ncbi:hypothetical protein CKAN_00447300 [Cinnamomum micranthum f. kanehirae]|uniref:Sulfotransferase n=1 Tax=Cinnamomum micranthum f. kanehirae TaxID=337451 RepID=A0A443NC26_9MAGN|nr:hypothetical protein CKAN_00447300 [Cinnamomum micranthum f. kanehirae]
MKKVFTVSEGMRHPCCWLGSSKSDTPSFDPTFLIHKEHEFGYQFCHRTEDEKLDHMMNHLSLYGKYECICFQDIQVIAICAASVSLIIALQIKPEYIVPIIKKADMHCDILGIPPEEILYVHFPHPKTYSRGECVCTPVRFFVILSIQRSGSGWFETLLNSHPNISSNGELFSVKERKSNMSTILSTLDTVYNLDWFSSAAKNECAAAVGFKWMLNQAIMDHHREIANYFNWKGVSVIFLFRRNLLRRLVSEMANAYDRNAKQLNGTHKSHVHSKEEAEVLAQFKPKLDVATLILHLSHVEQMIMDSLHYFNSTRHIILYYEDIVSNRKKLSYVQKFLRVPVRKLKSRQVKIHTRPLSEQVENWEDVYKALNGTQYTHFLHDTHGKKV